MERQLQLFNTNRSPAFRGLEPDLALSYDSSRGLRNIPAAGGLLGLGWTIDGLSVIERVSGSAAPPKDASGNVTGNKPAAGKGAPAYGVASLPPDSFVIDDAEMVACVDLVLPTPSPSCVQASGDTGERYATRFERFRKVRFLASTNKWEVTGQDGTKTTYTALDGGTSTTTFRWHIRSVMDTKGNHVDYTWSCETDKHCAIDRIQYFNTSTPGSTPATLSASTPVGEVRFRTKELQDAADQVHSNPVTYATGFEIRHIRKRLKFIEVSAVTASGALSAVRRYNLSYQEAQESGLSLLTSVQKVGMAGARATLCQLESVRIPKSVER